LIRNRGEQAELEIDGEETIEGIEDEDACSLSRRLGVLGASDISRVKSALRDLLNL
jgi:hypothetical protein